MRTEPHALLLPHVSQYDVDFVIPRVGVDIPLGIDPFLLFKSRDGEYQKLHGLLINMFNAGIEAVRRGISAKARHLLSFPEVGEIGLGYTQKSRRGSGVGNHLTDLIVETVKGSPMLQERGVRHIEEMQLVSAGIGPDRVSDIVANVLKRFLIEYTQRQCGIWNIPVCTGVPITHIYEPSTQTWEDAFEDLPVSPADGSAILLVPRRLVRTLPWINYDDFLRREFRPYLAARRKGVPNPSSPAGGGRDQTHQESQAKQDVATLTRADLKLVERYVHVREQQASEARPAVDYVDTDACLEGKVLKEKLAALPPGRAHASDYQRLVLEIMNYLFSPELIDGQPEVRTVDGTERRDIIFTNDSDETFWDYIRSAHDGVVVMFEAKNTDDLDLAAVNQTATYLGDRVGRFGVIVTRKTPPETIQRKIFSVWNDSAPNRKVIVTLSDQQIGELIDGRCENRSPTKWMQKHYRNFRTAVQ